MLTLSIGSNVFGQTSGSEYKRRKTSSSMNKERTSVVTQQKNYTSNPSASAFNGRRKSLKNPMSL
jgi:hypothetical protein